jgi:hypothetical protein
VTREDKACGLGFSQRFQQESKEPLRLNSGILNDPVSRRSGEETLRGDRLDLSASSGIRVGICLYIADRGAGRRQSTGGLCNDCLQVGNDQEDSQQDCKDEAGHTQDGE